jgi:hypothetical protein
VLAAERLHGDDTAVPLLAKGQTKIGRVWVCPRRSAVRGHGSSGGAVLRVARSDARTSRATFDRVAGVLEPTHSTATTASIFPTASPARSARRYAGAMRAASSSSWSTSPRTRDVARKRRRSRRSPWKPSGSSICAPGPYSRRERMAKPSAWSTQAYANGPMTAPTTPPTRAPPSCRSGFIDTIGTNLMAASDHPQSAEYP